MVLSMPDHGIVESKDLFITVRVPRDIHERISQLAAAADRTVAAEVREALRDRIAKFGSGPA